MNRFREYTFVVSENHARTCWVLKCDIKQFFGSIDHYILNRILWEYVPDEKIRLLLKIIIQSFETDGCRNVGLPLGNLTSQLFSNVFMNKFDQFVKHKLHIKYYVRYADDFVFLSHDKQSLQDLIPTIRSFLIFDLHLTLHPKKIFLKSIASGVDFLGWVHFTDHRVLRSVTKRRMMKRIETHPTRETVESYKGLLKHGNAKKLKNILA